MKVTAEVTPHHLTLTDEAVRETGYDTDTKMNPPLRSRADRRRCCAGSLDGTIDCIATDHAPHTLDDKKVEFDQRRERHRRPGDRGRRCASTGSSGRALVGAAAPRRPSLRNPARVLGLPGGTLAPGSPADVTVLDLRGNGRWTPARFESRSRNTPFSGWILKGWPAMTIVDGRVAWKDAR